MKPGKIKIVGTRAAFSFVFLCFLHEHSFKFVPDEGGEKKFIVN